MSDELPVWDQIGVLLARIVKRAVSEGQDLDVGHPESGGTGEGQLGLNVFPAQGPVENDDQITPADVLDSVDGGLAADGADHGPQYGASIAQAVVGQTEHSDGTVRP